MQRCAPLLHLLRGMREHPVADAGDQTAGLGYGDEVRRADQSTLRVLPADQGFCLVDRSGGQFHHGLVDHAELVLCNRRAHVIDQAQPLLRSFLQGGREKAVTVATCAFGSVEGLVCVFEQVVNFRAVRGVHGDANAGRHKRALAPEFKGLTECVQDFLQQGLQSARVADVGEDDGELVAAHACHRVGFPQAVLDAPRGFDQQRIATAVAQCVVDFLEVVQIDKKHRQLLPVALAAPDFLVQPVGQCAAVGQSGQRVEQGLLADQRLGLFAFGNVAVGADHPQRALVGRAADHHAPAHDPLPAAIAAAKAVLMQVA